MGGTSRIRVVVENQGCGYWFICLDKSDDPLVEVDDDGQGNFYQAAPTFSAFLLDWMWFNYGCEWTPLSELPEDPNFSGVITPKLHLNGLWLYAPRTAAVAPPYLDFLKETCVEDEIREIAPTVWQYRFHNEQGRIKITTDSYDALDGKAAWWFHADREDELEQLVKAVLWCGDLSGHLRCQTEQAAPVMNLLRINNG